MKLSIVTVLAVLALAGSATAQNIDHGTSGGATGGDYNYLPGVSANPLKSLREQYAAYEKMRLSCAADRQALCQGKHDGAAWRCVRYHALKLSRPCRADMEKALQGRL
jgi:hypothetical protein